MQIIGTVVSVNPSDGRFVVRSAGDKYSAWLPSESFPVQYGVRVQGNLTSNGPVRFEYVESGIPFEAIGESGLTDLATVLAIVHRK